MKTNIDYQIELEQDKIKNAQNRLKILELKKDKERILQEVLAKLDKIRELVASKDLKGLDEILGYSPAGDDHGCDNYLPMFDELFPGVERRDGIDLYEAVAFLSEETSVD